MITPKLLWNIGIAANEIQTGISDGNMGGIIEKFKRGIKIEAPTQKPKHLTQENSFPNNGILTIRYFLIPSNIDPFMMVEVIPHPNKNNKI